MAMMMDRRQTGPTTTPKCQRCFRDGHWTYECKNKPVFLTRPSRSEILKNPDLKPKGLDENESIPEIPMITDGDRYRDPRLANRSFPVASTVAAATAHVAAAAASAAAAAVAPFKVAPGIKSTSVAALPPQQGAGPRRDRLYLPSWSRSPTRSHRRGRRRHHHRSDSSLSDSCDSRRSSRRRRRHGSSSVECSRRRRDGRYRGRHRRRDSSVESDSRYHRSKRGRSRSYTSRSASRSSSRYRSRSPPPSHWSGGSGSWTPRNGPQDESKDTAQPSVESKQHAGGATNLSATTAATATDDHLMSKLELHKSSEMDQQREQVSVQRELTGRMTESDMNRDLASARGDASPVNDDMSVDDFDACETALNIARPMTLSRQSSVADLSSHDSNEEQEDTCVEASRLGRGDPIRRMDGDEKAMAVPAVPNRRKGSVRPLVARRSSVGTSSAADTAAEERINNRSSVVCDDTYPDTDRCGRRANRVAEQLEVGADPVVRSNRKIATLRGSQGSRGTESNHLRSSKRRSSSSSTSSIQDPSSETDRQPLVADKKTATHRPKQIKESTDEDDESHVVVPRPALASKGDERQESSDESESSGSESSVTQQPASSKRVPKRGVPKTSRKKDTMSPQKPQSRGREMKSSSTVEDETYVRRRPRAIGKPSEHNRRARDVDTFHSTSPSPSPPRSCRSRHPTEKQDVVSRGRDAEVSGRSNEAHRVQQKKNGKKKPDTSSSSSSSQSRSRSSNIRQSRQSETKHNPPPRSSKDDAHEAPEDMSFNSVEVRATRKSHGDRRQAAKMRKHETPPADHVSSSDSEIAQSRRRMFRSAASFRSTASKPLRECRPNRASEMTDQEEAKKKIPGRRRRPHSVVSADESSISEGDGKIHRDETKGKKNFSRKGAKTSRRKHQQDASSSEGDDELQSAKRRRVRDEERRPRPREGRRPVTDRVRLERKIGAKQETEMGNDKRVLGQRQTSVGAKEDQRATDDGKRGRRRRKKSTDAERAVVSSGIEEEVVAPRDATSAPPGVEKGKVARRGGEGDRKMSRERSGEDRRRHSSEGQKKRSREVDDREIGEDREKRSKKRWSDERRANEGVSRKTLKQGSGEKMKSNEAETEALEESELEVESRPHNRSVQERRPRTVSVDRIAERSKPDAPLSRKSTKHQKIERGATPLEGKRGRTKEEYGTQRKRVSSPASAAQRKKTKLRPPSPSSESDAASVSEPPGRPLTSRRR